MEDLNDILASGGVGPIEFLGPRCVHAGCDAIAVITPAQYLDPFWCEEHDPAKR